MTTIKAQQNNNNIYKTSNGITQPKHSKQLKEKLFVERKSLIVELYDEKHIRNIHNIFLVFLLTLCVNHILDGLIHNGSLSLHITLIYENFSDGYKAFQGWLIIFSCVLLIHPTFRLWHLIHEHVKKHPVLKKTYYALSMTSVLLFYYHTFKWSAEFVTQNDLSQTSSFTLLVETTRLLMKAHAFIRGNVENVLVKKEKYQICSFWHYFQFLFFPTLVYRDSYPRTNSINWLNVCVFGLEIVAVILFQCYLFNMYYVEDCKYLQTNTYNRLDILWLVFRNTIPALGHMILTFYIVLHAWQNFFGELTKFGDRQFYQDWWNSTSYDEYYRKWNIIVHDWLYNYIYKDVYELLTPNRTIVPKILVFLISAVVHEFILYYTLRMFYPFLLVLFFTFAIVLTSFRSPKNWFFSVLFLYGYAVGFSLTLTAYTTEYCVRKNPCAINSTKFPFEWLYSATFFSDCVN